ncbi:MAG: glycosyl hydrolase family 8 [Cyanobacteria bacterium J06638_22]
MTLDHWLNPFQVRGHLRSSQARWLCLLFLFFTTTTEPRLLTVGRPPAENVEQDTPDSLHRQATPIASEPGTPYPYGILPHNADVADARRAYDEWKALYISALHVPDSTSMLRVFNRPHGEGVTTSEYQGYGMVFAAHLEDDDAVLQQLWNYAEHYLNDEGLMKWHIDTEGVAEYRQSALDGDVDIAIALDYAARRWPNRGWEERAQTYIANILDPGKNSFLRTNPIDTSEWPRWKRGIYLNYLATAYMPHFRDRTRDDRWVDIAMPNTYSLLEHSYDNYVLPAWYVDATGYPAHPNDPWNSNINRHDRGATRTNWRIASHYLTTGHADAEKWVEKLTNFFYEVGQLDGARDTGDFSPTHLRIGYRFMTTDSHQAGEAYGDRKAISETMMVAAGVPAMATGNIEMTNEIYDFLAADVLEPDDIPMDNAMHVMGLLIMSGGLDAIR